MDSIDKNIENTLKLIRAKRRELKISQSKMAKYLGIALNSYRLIEQGKTTLKFKTIIQISNKLELDIFKQEEEQQPQTTMVSINDFKGFLDFYLSNEERKDTELTEIKTILKELQKTKNNQ